MTKYEAYKKIRYFELDVGEDFLDQNETIVNDFNLLFWLLGKGYISKNKANWWLNNLNEYVDLNYIFSTYQNENSLFPKSNTSGHLKKIELIAEMFEDIDVLSDRLNNTLKEFNVDLDYSKMKHTSIQYQMKRSQLLSIKREYLKITKLDIETVKNMED